MIDLDGGYGNIDRKRKQIVDFFSASSRRLYKHFLLSNPVNITVFKTFDMKNVSHKQKVNAN